MPDTIYKTSRHVYKGMSHILHESAARGVCGSAFVRSREWRPEEFHSVALHQSPRASQIRLAQPFVQRC